MSANPNVDLAEVEDMRQTLSARAFRQEVMGEFLSDSGGFFRNIRSCIVSGERIRNASYSLGIDFGRHRDFTALGAMDGDNYVFATDNWRSVPWDVTVDRILNFISVHGNPSRLVAENNSMGEPGIESLRKKLDPDIPIYKFQTTSKSKLMLMESLAVGIEQRSIKFAYFPLLISQLEAYEVKISPSGYQRLGAHEFTRVARGGRSTWKAEGSRSCRHPAQGSPQPTRQQQPTARLTCSDPRGAQEEELRPLPVDGKMKKAQR